MANRPGRFLGELKRRHVLRVVGVYAVGAWLAIQVADTTFPYFELPAWSVTAVIVLAIVGFPVAVAVAWTFDLTSEGVERSDASPFETSDAPALVRWSGMRLMLTLGMAAAASTAGWLWVRSYRSAPLQLDTVLVLPFQVSGTGELAYLRDGLVDLVARNLEGVTGLRALDPHTAIRLAEGEAGTGPIDAERGRALAARVGAHYFVLGTVTEHDRRLVLSARMFDAQATQLPVEASSVDGESAALFDLVDRLTARIVVSRFGPASTHVTRSATRTTPSADALKAFLRGEQELRGARYASAVAEFQNAVAEDSLFALAYYRLAVAAMLNHSGRLARDATERASSLGAQLGTRDHRLLDAYAAALAGRADEAEAAYTAILEEYPDDMEARVQLGGLLALYNPLRGRPATEANPHLRRVSTVDPAYVCPVCTMVNLALYERDIRAADSLMIVRYGTEFIRAYYAGAAAARGDTLALASHLPHLESPAYWQASWVAAFFDRYDLAQRLLEETGPLEDLSLQRHVIARMGLVDLHVARLRWQDAVTHIRSIQVVAPTRGLLRLAYMSLLPFIERPSAEIDVLRGQLQALQPATGNLAGEAVVLHEYLPLAREYLVGLASSRLGDSAEALAVAGRLERLVAPSPGLAAGLALSLRADVAIRENRFEQALAHLDSIRVEVPMEVLDAVAAGPGRSELADLFTLDHARYLRIRALLEQDRADEALRWIENGFFRVGGNPLYTPELHRTRAEALDRTGRIDESRSWYGRYLALTQSADDDLRGTPDRVRARLEVSSR